MKIENRLSRLIFFEFAAPRIRGGSASVARSRRSQSFAKFPVAVSSYRSWLAKVKYKLDYVETDSRGTSDSRGTRSTRNEDTNEARQGEKREQEAVSYVYLARFPTSSDESIPTIPRKEWKRTGAGSKILRPDRSTEQHFTSVNNAQRCRRRRRKSELNKLSLLETNCLGYFHMCTLCWCIREMTFYSCYMDC